MAETKDGYFELKDVLSLVYENSPTLQAAREELRITQELYPQARSGWLPSVSAESSVYATDIYSGNFNNGDGATTKDLTLSLDQPIWRGGRTFAETARAKAARITAESDLAITEARFKEVVDIRVPDKLMIP